MYYNIARHSKNATNSVNRGHGAKMVTAADVVAVEEGVLVLLAVWLTVLEADGVELLDGGDSSGDMTYCPRASC